MASLVSATFMLIIIVWIGPIFRTLPRAILSCIIGIIQTLQLWAVQAPLQCLLWFPSVKLVHQNLGVCVRTHLQTKWLKQARTYLDTCLSDQNCNTHFNSMVFSLPQKLKLSAYFDIKISFKLFYTTFKQLFEEHPKWYKSHNL